MPPFPSEFRHDPISGRTVIVARARGARPHDFQQRIVERVERPCPFCRGHEEETPTALAVYGDESPDGAQTGGENRAWLTRVIPNKYPALTTDAGLGSDVHGGAEHDAEQDAEPDFRPLPGEGAHEVIVEAARHVTCFSRLDDREASAAMRACRDRIRFHAQSETLRYAQVFKNTGHDAGASIEHVHSQLMATPFVPLAVQQELAGSEQFFQRRRACVFCDLLAREQSEGTRVVASSARFVALCPFAGRFPFEIWILPKQHSARFEELDTAAVAELGPLMRTVVGGMIGASAQPAYNYLLHTAPFDTVRPDHYHWHIEMFPRTSEVGGYEWATGCFINSVPPEEAAAAIRTACANISN